MSETKQDDSAADATFENDQDALIEDASAGADSAAEADTSPAKRTGASASVAWLALFLSLLTLAAVGYLALEEMRDAGDADANTTAIAGVENELRDTSQSVEAVRGSIEQLASADSRTNASVDALRQDLDQRAELFDSVPPRMSALERSVAALQGVSIETRNTYLIAEAEYYLQIGNAQLQLAGNPYLASLALSQADDRLLQLADPALTDVRRRIADELAALEVMEKPDLAGVTLILASLARVVDSLPMRGAADGGSASVGDGDAELSGTARAWAAVKDAASGLVKVTPPDGDQAALITPDVADLARSNLSLQLQAARLALLRGEPDIFAQSLDDADAWLDLYFDTGSEQVQSARATMSDIRNEYSAVAPPDISQSLRLLRQYKALAETTE
jgi:uroporphyrin-3 C-methyltransferase